MGSVVGRAARQGWRRARPWPGAVAALTLAIAMRSGEAYGRVPIRPDRAVGTPPAAHLTLAAEYNAKVDGVSMLVMHEGQVVFEDYPTRYHPDAGPDTAWFIASGTKSFSGSIATLLIADGLVMSFDERLAGTITEWQGDERKERITLRHLLSLTSGIAGGSSGGIPDYAEAIQAPAVAEPGTTFSYGPVPYQIFGEFVRRKLRAAGIGGARPDPVADYLRPRILDRIGGTPADWKYTATGDAHLPSGAAFTARMWAPYGELIRLGGQWQGERILPAATLDECFIGSAVRPAYGVTWWLESGSGDPVVGDLVSALGAGGQDLFVTRELGLVVVRQTSSTGRGDEESLARLQLFDQRVFWSLIVHGVIGQPDRDGDLIPDGRDAFPDRSDEYIDVDADGLGDAFEHRIIDHQPGDALRDLRDVRPEDDHDGDGATNGEEFLAGTDPTDPASRPGAGPRTTTVPPSASPTPTIAPATASPLPWRPEDVVIGEADHRYGDPEFLPYGALVTYFDEERSVWVAAMDGATGGFASGGGRDLLLATTQDDPPLLPGRMGLNGPEWGMDAGGPAVFFTKADAAGVHQAWRAVPPWGPGSTRAITDGGIRTAVDGASLDPGAPTTGVVLARLDGTAPSYGWADETRADAFQAFPEWIGSAARSVLGTPYLAYARAVGAGADRIGQIALVDRRTGQVRTVTDDQGDKRDPWGFAAPEYAGEVLLAANEADRAIAVYRDVADPRGSWRRIATLTMPADSPHQGIISMEPVLDPHQRLDRSYFTVKAYRGDRDAGDSAIWLLGLGTEAGERFARRVDDGLVTGRIADRKEPESWIGADELYVYYAVDRELHRCRTGVAAASGPVGAATTAFLPHAARTREAVGSFVTRDRR